jgi:murein DD-endopeptidase MepM/ murein hydrolase activator NlpD
MRTNPSFLVAGCGLALLCACCDGGCDGCSSNPVFQPLEFPFSNAGDIIRVAAYGIPNWSGSEPHNGIDLQVDGHLASARIISPTAGEVTAISTHENPYSDPPGQLLVTVTIRINGEWTVNLVLEPSTIDPALRTAQLAAILASEGQELGVGTPVADLLVGTLGYPHLHYMVEHNGGAVCAYTHSSDAAKAVFVTLLDLPDSSLPDGNICYGQP